MRKKLITTFSLVFILTGCTIFGGYYRPSKLTYQYDGQYTGIDTLINIDGYYRLKDPKYDYGGKPYYSNLMFYDNGLVCYAIANDAVGIFKQALYPVSAWGNYKIEDDTIMCQFITNDGVMGGVNVSKVKYLINSKSEIWEVNTSGNKFQYSFHPLENRIDSTNWLLKKKWFYEKKKKNKS